MSAITSGVSGEASAALSAASSLNRHSAIAIVPAPSSAGQKAAQDWRPYGPQDRITKGTCCAR